METIFLDNNATTCVAPEVLEAMLPFLTTRYGNPSSIHRFGGTVKKHIDTAREQVAALIHAHPEEICFTSCGSEADNMALWGFKRLRKNTTRIITSVVEHPAVRNSVRQMSEDGIDTVEIGVNGEGMIDLDRLKRMPIDADTLVSLMWANNETGVLFPIHEIASMIKSKGGFFHTDAVQAVGKIAINVSTTPVDYLALSGHKLHAPKGVGALYIRKGAALPPLLFGGHQENGLRAGTENVASIVGLGVACDLAKKHSAYENTQVRALRDKLENTLLATCTASRLNGHKTERLPNTTNISFENIEGEAILLMLDEKGIAASSGSACTTGSLEPSHVMRAMGIPYTCAHSSTRFSLSRYTTNAEIEAVLQAMPAIIDRLRSFSPFVK